MMGNHEYAINAKNASPAALLRHRSEPIPCPDSLSSQPGVALLREELADGGLKPVRLCGEQGLHTTNPGSLNGC